MPSPGLEPGTYVMLSVRERAVRDFEPNNAKYRLSSAGHCLYEIGLISPCQDIPLNTFILYHSFSLETKLETGVNGFEAFLVLIFQNV